MRGQGGQITITGNSAHNHVCGCTKCWKPGGALFSMVAVVPRDKLKVTANGDKLQGLDPAAAIQPRVVEGRDRAVRAGQS